MHRVTVSIDQLVPVTDVRRSMASPENKYIPEMTVIVYASTSLGAMDKALRLLGGERDAAMTPEWVPDLEPDLTPVLLNKDENDL